MSRPSSDLLLLVPTPLERARLGKSGLPGLQLVGFGPIAAAALTAELIGKARPRKVLLVGIAGTLDPLRLAPGQATSFGRVELDGLGAGQGRELIPPSALGLAQCHDAEGQPLGEALDLADAGPLLLTVCAASARVEEARFRAERYGAIAEDMEAFGVALACRRAGVALSVIRGISNLAGERDKAGWCIDLALDAAAAVAHSWLEAAEGRA